MDQILKQDGEYRCCLSDSFDSRMLRPLILNLLEKAEQEWDDYDEVSHACHLIEQIAQDTHMQMDFHTLRRQNQYEGLVLMTHGQLTPALFFQEPFLFREPLDKILFLNYFHITENGWGRGERWLREVVCPKYQKQGFLAIYLKSSHPRSFSLYRRLGEEIGAYTRVSDNGKFLREGRIFRIGLNTEDKEELNA